jgi:predicted SnoaL-like aldol condensation-catalyzing enzyme
MKTTYTTWINEVWSNNGNTSTAEKIISNNFIDHNPHKDFGNDKKGHIAMAEDWHKKFKSVKLHIADTIISGDKLVGRYTGECVPHSGEKFSFSEIDIVRIENNQIVEWWHNDDLPAL